MKSAFVQRMDLWARHLMPAATTLFLVLLSAVPLGIPGYAQVAPSLTLMSVFYWAVYRPDLMPPSLVFLVGLAEDLLNGYPFGLTAIVFLGVYGITGTQRPTFLSKPFFIVWGGFVVISFGAFLLGWMLMSVFTLSWIFPDTVLFRFGLTATLFPAAAWIFVRIHRYLVR
ncbi:rod shape-determining protein MreD [Nisaea acidiphila]|uniref:Rod shape-determining protein MreD n=1 Tax=Nisaea acidiphila TaxID=1862145 RepID=A0A9J7ASK9_9PROT|nr:rod shape-determining protein MreD [Nisaea acidiphila]UUX49489.1 rod shape-determining protein MreD [Nisaea acidiphila]